MEMKGRRCKKRKIAVTKRDTAISLLKEGGESPLRRTSKLADVKIGIFCVTLSFEYYDNCRITYAK